VVEAVTEALDELPLEFGRSSGPATSILQECRASLAGLMQVERPERIALVSGATQALNQAVLGLDLKAGERVITSVTEHNSVLRPLNHLRRNRGIDTAVVGLDASGQLDVAAFEKELAAGARLVVLNHISNVTGQVNPVADLFRCAKAAGAITLLDASQSLGCIPVLPLQLQADLVVFTGHKALRGPSGTGGLYVRPGIELEQVLVGGTGVHSDLPHHPSQMPMRLEAGTPGLSAFAGLAAALRWVQRQGEAFRRQQQRLCERLAQGLREISKVRLFGAADPNQSQGPLSFQIEGWAVQEAGEALSQGFGIIGRTGLHCAPLIHAALGSAPEGTIRFAPSGFNTETEIDWTLNAVHKLAA